MKSSVAKLPEFVGGAVDFGALSCATNLCKTLGKVGCMHVVSLNEREEFEGPSELGGSLRDVSKSIKNFMKHTWFKFGHANARSLAEAHRAAVHDLILLLFLIFDP